MSKNTNHSQDNKNVKVPGLNIPAPNIPPKHEVKPPVESKETDLAKDADLDGMSEEEALAAVDAAVVKTEDKRSEKLTKVEKRKLKIPLEPIDVVATVEGYYGNKRQKLGYKFTLDDVTDFSHIWMKKV